LKLGIGAWSQKNQNDATTGPGKNLTISLAVWIQYTNVTEGRTPADGKDCGYA